MIARDRLECGSKTKNKRLCNYLSNLFIPKEYIISFFSDDSVIVIRDQFRL